MGNRIHDTIVSITKAFVFCFCFLRQTTRPDAVMEEKACRVRSATPAHRSQVGRGKGSKERILRRTGFRCSAECPELRAAAAPPLSLGSPALTLSTQHKLKLPKVTFYFLPIADNGKQPAKRKHRERDGSGMWAGRKASPGGA